MQGFNEADKKIKYRQQKNKKMKKQLIVTFIIIITISNSWGQVGIGTSNPNSAAALEIQSTSKGFLPPRLTEAQIQTISNPPEGLIVYCTNCTTKGLLVFNGSAYINLTNGNSGTVPTITSAGGAVWMDRNLGATQVASSSTDVNAYGDLYQWGRNADGHQLRNSSTTAGPVASGNEGSNFITTDPINGKDWLTVFNNTRWDGSTKGVHDPCPTGFRVPTQAEWNTEVASWSSGNAAGAFASPLKLAMNGDRSFSGTLTNQGQAGYYWSSTVFSNTSSHALNFLSFDVNVDRLEKARGFGVRCIKE